MPAYVLGEVEITDPAAIKQHAPLVAQTIQKFGGRYLTRAQRSVALEGLSSPHNFFLVEFPDKETALSWFTSPEYAIAKASRGEASRLRLLLIDGVDRRSPQQPS
jgi:uncharacterized protein (DUF1330 family)